MTTLPYVSMAVLLEFACLFWSDYLSIFVTIEVQRLYIWTSYNFTTVDAYAAQMFYCILFDVDTLTRTFALVVCYCNHTALRRYSTLVSAIFLQREYLSYQIRLEMLLL